MSHSIGEIEFKDGTNKFFEFDETTYVATRKIYDTIEEVRSHWREWLEEPICNHEEENVILCVDNETKWASKVCRKCGFITGDIQPPL